MLTSGSTGHPKAVRLSHANLLAALPAKAERLGATACDTTMNWISFDHISAIEMHLLPTSVGATQVQVAPESVLGDPLRFLRLADAHRVTLTFTPNFLFAQLNRAMDRLDDGFTPDLSALRRVISGGEATVCATVRGFLDRLAPFGLDRGVVSPAFGMTETCAGSVFSLDFPDVDDGQEFASLGRAVAGLEMRVVGADDAPLPGGRDGELQVRGPMVFDGYLGDAAATAAAFTPDGWFRTGDRDASTTAGSPWSAGARTASSSTASTTSATTWRPCWSAWTGWRSRTSPPSPSARRAATPSSSPSSSRPTCADRAVPRTGRAMTARPTCTA